MADNHHHSNGLSSQMIALKDLNMHVLTCSPGALPDTSSPPPLLVLLHGFPELSFSWRNVMLPLARQGYFVVAPDQRGYGGTVRSPSPNVDHDDYKLCRMSNLVDDIVALVNALGYTHASAVIGHDFGSLVAAHCALLKPTMFSRVVMMSAPFSGVSSPVGHGVMERLNSYNPPRKHYTAYFSSAGANPDILNAPQGLRTFLREYFYAKSADNPANQPHPISLDEFDQLPRYYLMLASETMPEAVQGSCSPDYLPTWLSEDDLDVYVRQFQRSGFQGGLHWYRCMTGGESSADLQAKYGNKEIEVPAMFIGGKQDWGTWQSPGAVDKMRSCRSMREDDFVLVDGAGHWIQQEQPQKVVDLLLKFLARSSERAGTP